MRATAGCLAVAFVVTAVLTLLDRPVWGLALGGSMVMLLLFFSMLGAIKRERSMQR